MRGWTGVTLPLYVASNYVMVGGYLIGEVGLLLFGGVEGKG